MNLPTYETKPIPGARSFTSFGEEIDPVVALNNCEVGKCFSVDDATQRRRMHGYADRLGMEITTSFNRKTGKYEIWRVK